MYFNVHVISLAVVAVVHEVRVRDNEGTQLRLPCDEHTDALHV